MDWQRHINYMAGWWRPGAKTAQPGPATWPTPCYRTGHGQEPRSPKGESTMAAANAMSLAGGVSSPARPARGRTEAGLSIVIPLFNEAGNLPGLHARIMDVAKDLRTKRHLAAEVIYVD